MAIERTSALLWAATFLVAGSLVGAQSAAAVGVPFFDDLSDMNFSDNSPVILIPVFVFFTVSLF